MHARMAFAFRTYEFESLMTMSQALIAMVNHKAPQRDLIQPNLRPLNRARQERHEKHYEADKGLIGINRSLPRTGISGGVHD